MIDSTFKDLPHGCYFKAKLPCADAPDVLFTFVKKGSYADEATLVGENGIAGSDLDWPDTYPQYPSLGEFAFRDDHPCSRLEDHEWPDVSKAMMDKCRADFTWDKAVASVIAEKPFKDFDCDDPIHRHYLGSILSLYPSGKIYAFWTSNQTPEDVNMDQEYADALEHLAEEQGLYLDHIDGDVFLCKTTTFQEVAEAAGYKVYVLPEGQHYWQHPTDPQGNGGLFEEGEEAWEDCCRVNNLVEF